jgi:hypothetical protein
VRLTQAGGAEDERAAVLGDEAQGGEVQDQLLRDLGVEAPVELIERLGRRHLGLLHAALEEQVASACELVLDQQLQELRVGEVIVDGLLVAHRQGLNDAGQAEVTELAIEVGVHDHPPAATSTA